jgi:hypothetical protein
MTIDPGFTPVNTMESFLRDGYLRLPNITATYAVTKYCFGVSSTNWGIFLL